MKFSKVSVLTSLAVATTAFSSTVVNAAENAAITGAISTGITDAGDTGVATYILVIGAFVLLMAGAWALSILKRNRG